MSEVGRKAAARRARIVFGGCIAVCVLGVPVGAATRGVTASAAPPSSVCAASASALGWTASDVAAAVNVGNFSQVSTTPNPLRIPLHKSRVWTDGEIGSTPGPLPPNTLGIGAGDTSGVTGSAATPVPAGAFAAGFEDETELDEFPLNATTIKDVLHDTSVKTSSLPAGTVRHLAGGTHTGRGLPYVAVFPVHAGSADFSGAPLVAAVPVSIAFQNYVPSPSKAAPPLSDPSCKPAHGDNHYSVLGFDVTPYIGNQLQSGATYAAYLLARDTDLSGPLGDHLWYFRASSGTSAASGGTVTGQVHGATVPVPATGAGQWWSTIAGVFLLAGGLSALAWVRRRRG